MKKKKKPMPELDDQSDYQTNQNSQNILTKVNKMDPSKDYNLPESSKVFLEKGLHFSEQYMYYSKQTMP